MEEQEWRDANPHMQRISKDTYVFKSLKADKSVEIDVARELDKINVVNNHEREPSEYET